MRFSDEPVEVDTVGARQQWLSLGSACRILGVNESTMRRWADAGQVRTFRTPGGHRRFSETDLRAMLAGQGGDRTPNRFDELGSVAITRIRRQLERGPGHDAPWYHTVDADSRERLRPLGRRLVGLIAQYVGKRSRRHALLDEAHSIGTQYGRELAAAGVSLPQAVEALLFFRKNLGDAARQLDQRRQNGKPEEFIDLHDQIVNQADQVLLGLAKAYEAHYTGISSGTTLANSVKDE